MLSPRCVQDDTLHSAKPGGSKEDSDSYDEFPQPTTPVKSTLLSFGYGADTPIRLRFHLENGDLYSYLID
ncbi:hypothetical protein EI77_01156 [Prosthecobacter fusiformis]|uniref:Uncharacterized protein n=1 Tax=Prosthecobacter fusiformis TaxID=48464 RepID=A0A4R7SS61_9BACT|nr:hypothetical protein [Prosthecobacter fusiformis]TDU81844.1 hypothetical protein EI77_01156 [Prosthecobacter fusiformis]